MTAQASCFDESSANAILVFLMRFSFFIWVTQELDWNVFERAGSLPRSRSSNFWESLFSQGSANIEAEQSSEGSSRRRSDDDMLRFSEGDVLARQGEHDGDGAFFIVEGQVEAVLELPDGTECVVDVHPANSYAAELCPFGMVPRQPVTYRARTETVKAHWLSTACLNALLERKTSFAQCTNAIPHKARQQRPSLFSVQNKLKAIERAGQSTDSKGDEEAHGRSEDT